MQMSVQCKTTKRSHFHHVASTIQKNYVQLMSMWIICVMLYRLNVQLMSMWIICVMMYRLNVQLMSMWNICVMMYRLNKLCIHVDIGHDIYCTLPIDIKCATNSSLRVWYVFVFSQIYKSPLHSIIASIITQLHISVFYFYTEDMNINCTSNKCTWHIGCTRLQCYKWNFQKYNIVGIMFPITIYSYDT